jgi:hypothetical protein
MGSRAAILQAAWNRFGTAALSAITIAALIAYPLPFCIDCEYPNQWGDVAVKAEIPTSTWLLTSAVLLLLPAKPKQPKGATCQK